MVEFDEKDYPGLTDEILFNRYGAGDTRAFDEILNRNKGLVYSLILRFVKAQCEADEIFQDVFLKVCRNKDQFREAVSFKSWLATITRNTCIDYTRKAKRTLRTESLDYEDDDRRSLSEVVPSEEATPFDELITQIENENLAELLDELPQRQKETFYLKVVMEMTFEEIGTSMACSTNTAKSRYRYALESLRGLVRRRRLLEKAV